MARYGKGEAREWAMSSLKGMFNVIIPSFTNDLKGLNEAAIRHDVRKNIELGFDGALRVGEVIISPEEYRRFSEITQDEGKGRQSFVHHATGNTLADTIEGLKVAEECGADFILLTYPVNFYPESLQDVYDYTRAVCDTTHVGVLLFPVPVWGFSPRLGPADIPVELLRKLIDDCPNIVAIKAENGYPGIMGVIECWRAFGEEVVISCPIEADLLPLAQIMPIRLAATSDYEYYGSLMPRAFAALRDGRHDEATALFWQAHAARRAKGAAQALGGLFANRMQWKFAAWLQGYSGGPLRGPCPRINDAQMNGLRNGLTASKLLPKVEPNADFFRGRFPD